MSSNRDSEGKYQDGCEDALIAAGQSSQDKRKKAKEEKAKKDEEDRQVGTKQAMFDAGQASRERRKKKGWATLAWQCSSLELHGKEAMVRVISKPE
jgi:hypothetical protein